MTVNSSDSGPQPNTRRPQRDWLSIAILGFALLLCGAVWYLVEWLTDSSRRSAIENARQQNANLARALEGHTDRTLDYLDDHLMAIQKKFEAERTAFDLEAFFREKGIDPKIARNALITDANGNVILGSHGAPAISLADREHFQIHLK